MSGLCLPSRVRVQLSYNGRVRVVHLRHFSGLRGFGSHFQIKHGSGSVPCSIFTGLFGFGYEFLDREDLYCKALQRVVRLAERISGSALPSLQDIYLKRCRSRAFKIKDSNHPGNCLFTLLPSGKRFRCLMAKTERLRWSFFPQAIRLLNSNSAS